MRFRVTGTRFKVRGLSFRFGKVLGCRFEGVLTSSKFEYAKAELGRGKNSTYPKCQILQGAIASILRMPLAK